MLVSCAYLIAEVALTLLLVSVPFIYGADQSTEMLLAASRRHRVGPELMWLYKQRVRRAEPDCTSEAENNVELQKAVASMVIGNDDKSYLTRSIAQQHKHRAKLGHDKMCEEENEQEEISPDMTIKERALCSFVYVENYNKTRLPQTIPEVQCSCTKPSNKMILSRFPNIRCEAIYYDVPVLKFVDGCTNYIRTTERLTLACIPVLGTQSTSKVLIESNDGQQSELPI
ncbi:hypothetical protein M3Y97_00784500 [Aphelenchoides bicaudatus]|nr:hypothetical protein M3Y97_00784500 [Aphelenchoides bicaudatus]